MTHFKELLAICATFATVAGVRAEDMKQAVPTLVVQLKSVEGLLNDVKYVAKLIGRGEQVDQFDGLIAAFAGPNGLAGSGLDVKRPFLAYANAKSTIAEGAVFAIMIPISDEATFLRLLESLNVKSEPDNEGVRTIEMPNLPVSLYFKFSNKYAYLTAQSKGNLLPKNLVRADTLVSTDPNVVLGMRLRIDQIPDELKNLALGQMELRLASIKDQQRPDETPDQARTRRVGLDAFSQAIKYVLSEGRALEFHLAFDREKDDIATSLSLDGKPSTMLTNAIGMLGTGKTRFAASDAAALHVGLNMSVPQMFRPFVSGIIDAGFGDLMAREADPAKKEIGKKLFTAVAPTLKAGEVDFHLVGGGPNAQGHFTMLAALGVQNGMGIETAVKELVAKMPEDRRNRIKLDSGEFDGVNVHKMEIPPEGLDANAKRLAGDPSLWAGFTDKSLMLGLGADAKGTFSAVTPAAAAIAAPSLIVEGSVARLATMDKELPGIDKLAEQVFGKSPRGKDTFRLCVEGGDKLRVTASMKGLNLKFFTIVNERKSGL